MRIAYIISAHKLPEQLIRLVNRLHTPRSSFFIHVDKKTPPSVFNAMQNGMADLSNVFFVKRHSIYWGEPTVLDASLEGFRALFASGVAFDCVILMSGQDYPLVSNEDIEAFFDAHPDKQFIEWKDYRQTPPDAGWPQSGEARVTNWHFRVWKMNFVVPGRLEWNAVNRYCRSRYKWMPAVSAIWAAMMALLPIKRRFPAGLKPYFYGSAFGAISREFATYIHGLIASNDPFYRFFRYVDIADEMFYQSIAMSSPFAPNVVNDNLYCIDWKNPNPQVPRTFVGDDFDQLVSSGKLFARKFDITRDAQILGKLDQHALGEPEPVSSDLDSRRLVPELQSASQTQPLR